MSAAAPSQARSVYRHSWWWNAAFSMLWFANNWKWFIILLVVLPSQVAGAPDVPARLQNTYWGWVFAAGAVWGFIGPVLLGGLSDRLGRRRVFLITGSILTVCALLFLAGANRFWLIAAGYLFLQVSDDVIQGAYGSLVPQVVPEEHQPRASAVLSALNLFAQIGTAITALVLARMTHTGLTFAQLVYIGVCLVQLASLGCVLWALRGLKEPIPSSGGEPSEEVQGGFFAEPLIAPFRSHDFRSVWISRLLMMLGFYLVQPYMQFFLDKVVGVSGPGGHGKDKLFVLFGQSIWGAEMAQSVVLLSLSFAGAVGAILSTRRMDRWGLRKTVAFAGMVIGPVLAVIAFTKDFSFLWVLAMAFGFAHGTFLSADWALGAAVVPDQNSLGKDMAIWSSAVLFAQVVAGMSGGLIDSLNALAPGRFWGYSTAFLLAGVFMFTGSRLVYKVRNVR